MKKHDLMIIAAVAVISGLLFLFLYGPSSHSGAYVQIEIDGKVTQTLPLSEDQTFEIKTENGTNTLEIKNGCAQIIEADCPDKICKSHAKIRRSGESIICLPHKLVISIADEKTEDDIDIKV